MNDLSLPNMDAMDESELATLAETLAVALAMAKALHRARGFRMSGLVEAALKCEREAEKQYGKLPVSVRW